MAAKYFSQARSFLEIGCGNGYVLNAMLRSRSWDRIVGSELHTSGLLHAKHRMPTGVEFVQMDARNIPAENIFDLVGAFDVLEHIPDDVAVLHGLRKSMVLGGGIIITVPQHPWLWSPADDAAFHQRRYRPNELENKLTGSGFEIVFSSSFTSLLLPLMMASRLMDNLRKEEYRFGREFEISQTLNTALKALLRVEIGATLRGFRWPIGGSRLVVARAS